MKLLLIFYIGFTAGICIMDYLDVKNTIDVHIYKRSLFNVVLATLFSPITFPIYLLSNIKGR